MADFSFSLSEGPWAEWRLAVFVLALALGWALRGALASAVQALLRLSFFKKELTWFAPFRVPLSYLALFGFYFLCAELTQMKHPALLLALKAGLGLSVLFLIHPAVHWMVDSTRIRFSDPLYSPFFTLLKKFLSIAVFILGGLMLIQNLGYNVTSLLAGLGLGGAALALASKDAISNFFGSIVILFDKPFIIGDWIQFEDTEGTVEHIGFRSTQIKTFYDSVISVPNALLANVTVDNLGKRKARRLRFELGLVYSTPPEKITAFTEGIKNIIKNHPKTKKDYFQVSFSGYGSSSLNIFINLFLHTTGWDEELEARQSIFLEILKLSQNTGVEFAFPSQSLYFENAPPKV